MKLIKPGTPFLTVFVVLLNTFFSTYATAPKYSNEFLSLGVGARAFGMANVQTAIVNDVTSAYWNPAGLTRITSDRQLSLMHAEYFAGIAKYDYGGFALPMDSTRCLAFSVIRFGVDDIPNTINLIDANGNVDYSKITSFSVADYAFISSYAKKTSIEGLSYGVNAKVIHRIVGDFAKAWGFGLDAAIQFRKNDWQFGFMGRDITSTFNAWNFTLSDRVKEVWQLTGNEIPSNHLETTLPKLISGGAYNLKISSKFRLLTALDMDMSFDGNRNTLVSSNFVNIDPKCGIELSYNRLIYLRGGIGNFQKISDFDQKEKMTFQPNFGIGLKIKKVTIDYALTDIGDQSIALYSNIFSLKIDLYKK